MRADLALIGFGNVGRRFASLIDERRGQLSGEHGLDSRIVGIATRRHGAVAAADGIDVRHAIDRVRGDFPLPGAGGSSTSEVIAALAQSDAPLRVIVETTTLSIIDGQPAISHVEAAIDAGCHVVTANKGPVAFAYRRLHDRAATAGVSFLFEGAVMDGVPIFNLVRETLPAVTILGFRGVVNSTTNYILSALEQGQEFAPALAEMQAAGIAEADASLDIDGWDAAAKTAALANVLMRADIDPTQVDRTGIRSDNAAQARAARAGGRRLRLVASAVRSAAGVVASVRPEELPGDDLLARLQGPANALVLHTDLLGEIAVHQLGGNLTMTAYALLSDLVTIRRRAEHL